MSNEDQEEGMIEDWRTAIEDLKDNNRHEIIGLTNLARELTAIAFPIAEILEQHIKKVRLLPSRRIRPCVPGNFTLPREVLSSHGPEHADCAL